MKTFSIRDDSLIDPCVDRSASEVTHSCAANENGADVLHRLPSLHPKLASLPFWNALSDALHIGDKLAVSFISTDAYAKQSAPRFHFEDNKLKSPRCLDEHLAADMHPLDV